MLLLRVHALKFKSLFELLLCDVKNGALRKAVGANSPIGCGSLGRRGRGWGGASVVVDAVVSPETSGVAAGEAGAHFSSSPRRVALAFPKQHNTLKLIVTDVQMPGRLNGIELANYIGEHWPDISIIVASGAVIPEEGESSDPRSFPQQTD